MSYTMEQLREGFYPDFPMESYVADPCVDPSLSKGIMHKLLTKTPAHARQAHPRLNPDREDDNSGRADIGSAVHSMILGGAEVQYEVFPDFKTKAAREWRDGVYNDGGIPILEKNRAAVENGAGPARAKLATLPGWDGKVETEGTMIWQDGGAWKRGRFDMWAPGPNKMIDVKTTTAANPGDWIRKTMVQGGYDLQAEHYLQGLRANGKGNEHTEFLFLLVEIAPPYCCAFVGLDPAYSDAAKRKCAMATRTWTRCMKSGQWPGYTDMIHYAEWKPWQDMELAEQLLIETERQKAEAAPERVPTGMWGQG